MNLLYPKLRRAEWLASLRFAAIGSLIAGVYGIVHDQVTYSWSAEYFTKLKFHQFAYADLGFGPRFFAGTVGLLATWWVGFIAGWFLGRLSVKQLPAVAAGRAVTRGFAIIFGAAFIGGSSGWLLGRSSTAIPSHWQPVLRQFEIEQSADFIMVAYVHNGGYAGALIGFVIAALGIRRRRKIMAADAEALDRCSDNR